jgi:predicted phage tail protein
MGRALGVGQGTPIREGDTIRIHIDKERSVSGLATMGSTLVGEESTFIGSYLSPKKRPNQVTVDFLDANNAFRPTTATWTDPDIDAPGDASYINTSGFEGHGITRRGQATRHAMLAVNKNKLQTRSGSFKSGASVMAWQVGDVINISNDLIPRGQGGRIASHASTSDTVIYLDTDVIIAASSSIKVFRIESGEITTVTVTTTGSQAAGSPITVATLGVTPQAGDEFLIYTAAELLSGEVTRRTTDQSRTSTIEWIEYPGSSVYVDRLPTAVTETAFGPSPHIATATLPDPATSVTAEDRISQDPRTGEFRRVVQVSWTHPSRTAVALRETVIYARSEDGEWEQVAKAEGHQTSATFTLPGAQFGDIYEVAFQPVAVEGQRKPARFCSSIRLAMSAVPELPDAPTGLAAVLDGDHAVYSWTLPSPELKVQIRRGGWVLGQIVGTSEPGATSMRTEDWIRYGAGSWGGDNLTLYARTMNAAGEFSKAADSLDTFNPSPEDAEDLITVLEWADYGDDQPAGWGSALTPDPDNVVLTDMALHASGYLEFTGSALTASAEMAAMGYDSTYWPVAYDNDIRPVRTYVHAAAEIEQVKADFTTPLWDTTDTRYDRYLTEGPMTIHGDETVNCTAKIMWKYRAKEGDAFTPYQEYTPGIARPYEVRFRLDFTRPDTTYNLKVHRFSTYLTEVPPQKNERGPLQSFGWNVVNG